MNTKTEQDFLEYLLETKDCFYNEYLVKTLKEMGLDERTITKVHNYYMCCAASYGFRITASDFFVETHEMIKKILNIKNDTAEEYINILLNVEWMTVMDDGRLAVCVGPVKLHGKQCVLNYPLDNLYMESKDE